MVGETLEKAFKDGYVHFTQFVNAGDNSTITDEAAYLLFTRAAAIQGYWNMPKADLVIPVCICPDANPTRWSMTAILIQVKNRVDKQPILIDAQQTFGFFTKSTMKKYNKHPYITIVMELGMLTPQQRKAPQPHPQLKAKQVLMVEGKQGSKGKEKQGSKGKGKQGLKEKGKEHETAMPATPKRNLAPQVPSSPTKVEVISRSHEQTTRSMLRTHPRYEIFIRGCSKRVYNVIGEVSYSTLLAHKDILAEHPRDGG
ncbi:hypothetical protein C0995_002409, partial [Termitomyces sp. Mi166